jgi:hypothetical protein
VREVFEELGLENETLEKAVEHVGASDDTLMAFMKVSALFCTSTHVSPLSTSLH